ncbi:peroxisomal membrane protein PMP34 [Culicoides brevitarsis]|uniref:peroxisomal membrane protein PMP34 n=1 Tax=Culicoides brevitarsis TaxID=469753 RepID=UPI00307B1FAB
MAPAPSKTLSSVFSYQSFVHAFSGACGGIVAMSTFYPLDTVRHHLQLEDPDKKKRSTFEVLQQIVKDEGFSSLYRGLIPVLQSLCISNFVYFYSFHSLKALNASGSQYAMRDLLLGSLAGCINVMGTTPFWVVNTRLKMADVRGEHRVGYDNLLDGLFYIARNEGITALWAGAAAGLVLVINPAIQFMTYESIKRRFLLNNKNVPAATSFAIGAIAKAVATILTYPLQLVQTRLRHGTKGGNLPPNMGTIKMLLHILRTQGAAGLFRGLEAKLLQTVLTAALMFMTYEKIATFVKSLLIKNTPKLIIK